MVFEVTLGNVITVVALVIAACWALFKLASVRQERRMDERFESLHGALHDVSVQHTRNAQATLELERQLLKHQADVERVFVRRDDFVRHIGALEARIDNFALRVERALDILISGRP